MSCYKIFILCILRRDIQYDSLARHNIIGSIQRDYQIEALYLQKSAKKNFTKKTDMEHDMTTYFKTKNKVLYLQKYILIPI